VKAVVIERPHEAAFREVELLGAGVVDFEPVVARCMPAERFEDAFRLMAEADGVVGRILLEHA
jgi:hypothetical protein